MGVLANCAVVDSCGVVDDNFGGTGVHDGLFKGCFKGDMIRYVGGVRVDRRE